jgi:hypothetical protein
MDGAIPVNRQCSPESGFPVHLWSMTNFTAPREFFRGHIFCVTGNVLMKITHLKLGQEGTSSVSKRHVTICAELDGPHEFMTMTVRVPNSGSDRDDRENGIARAKEFARGFSDLSTALFPVRDNATTSRRL